MNVNEWQNAIASALTNQGRQPNDQGMSDYNRLRNTAKAEFRSGNGATIVEAWQQCANAGLENNLNWWLAFLNLLDGVEHLKSPNIRSRLVTFVESNLDVEPQVRGYMLRQLCEFGFEFNWNRVRNQPFYDQLSAADPLLLADALVRAQRLDLAKNLILNTRNHNQVQTRHIEMLIDRWKNAGLKIPDLTPNDDIRLMSTLSPPVYNRIGSQEGHLLHA